MDRRLAGLMRNYLRVFEQNPSRHVETQMAFGAAPSAGFPPVSHEDPYAQRKKRLAQTEKKKADVKPVVECSFCGKRKDEVAQLVAGPTTHICEECVAVCAEIIAYDHPGWIERVFAKISSELEKTSTVEKEVL